MDTPPSAAELMAAFALIERAEKHMEGLAVAAGIDCTIYVGPPTYDFAASPDVSINARGHQRVFKDGKGRRTLGSIRVFWPQAPAAIAEAGEYLKSRK